MKKIYLALLTFLFVLGLAACELPFGNSTTTKAKTSAEPTTAAHVHEFGEWTVTKEATCKEEGIEERKCACGETETRTIEKTTNHDFGEWTVTKEATCKEEGSKERVCSICGEKETEAIEKTTNHDFGEWTVTKEATCKEEGSKERVCSICGEKETEAIEKTTDHDFGEWTVTKEATCKEEGSKERVCSICGEKETEAIEKTTDHNFGEWTITVEPDKGVKGTKERVCSVCGEKETEDVADTGVYANENWAVSGTDSYAYQYVEDTIINRNSETMTNENHYDIGNVNMNVYQPSVDEFYTMSVKIKGTITSQVSGTNDVYAGVLLNYVDEDNYIAFVIRWTTWDRPTEIRSVFFIQVVDGVYTNLGDNWTDGCSILPGSAINLTVVKSLSINGVVYTVNMSAKGGTWTKECKTTFASVGAGKVGLIGANDKFVYSGFEVAENEDVVKTISYTCESDVLTLNYYDGSYELTGTKASTGTYALSGKTATLTPTEGEEVIATLGNDGTFEYYVAPPYTIEYTLNSGDTRTLIESTDSDYTISLGYIGTKASGFSQDDKVGVKVWYIDENNYLDAYIQWGEQRNGHDEVRELSINGYIDGQFTGWLDIWADGFTNLPCDGGQLIVTKEGNTFTVTMIYGDKTKSGSNTFANLPAGAYSVKAYASGTEFSFYDTTIELDADEALNLSNITGDFTVEFDATGTIATDVTGDVQVGLELYSDDDNYLKAYSSWVSWDRPQEIRNLEICGKMSGSFAAGSEWHDTWTDGSALHPCDTIHYVINRTGNVFTLTITSGEYTKTATLDVTDFNTDEDYTAKIYVVGDNFKLTNYSLTLSE